MSNLKNLISIIFTLGVLIGVTWLLSYFMKSNIIDYAFIVGLFVTSIIRFFTSSGGYYSNNVKLAVQAHTGIKVDEENSNQPPKNSSAFLVSLTYTITALIVTVVYYWKEF